MHNKKKFFLLPHEHANHAGVATYATVKGKPSSATTFVLLFLMHIFDNRPPQEGGFDSVLKCHPKGSILYDIFLFFFVLSFFFLLILVMTLRVKGLVSKNDTIKKRGRGESWGRRGS